MVVYYPLEGYHEVAGWNLLLAVTQNFASLQNNTISPSPDWGEGALLNTMGRHIGRPLPILVPPLFLTKTYKKKAPKWGFLIYHIYKLVDGDVFLLRYAFVCFFVSFNIDKRWFVTIYFCLNSHQSFY